MQENERQIFTNQLNVLLDELIKYLKYCLNTIWKLIKNFKMHVWAYI